jgi:hypothetical protein
VPIPWPSGYVEKEEKEIIMSQERDRILDLLGAGKITAEEAGRLLDAIDARAGQTAGDSGAPGASGTWAGATKTGPATPPKYIYVKVLSTKGDNVNVKVPISLVRAGLKLTSLIPQQAMDQIDKSMAEKGMSFDFKNLKAEDMEDIVEALREMEINVDSANGDNVRVYAA